MNNNKKIRGIEMDQVSIERRISNAIMMLGYPRPLKAEPMPDAMLKIADCLEGVYMTIRWLKVWLVIFAFLIVASGVMLYAVRSS